MIGSIEVGGTKINCAVGLSDGTILKKVQYKTVNPDDNVQQIVAFFTENQVDKIGIGCFGPVNVDEHSPDYGSLLDTPKQAWRFYPFLRNLKERLAVPIKLHSDVTVSGLGEALIGGGRGDEVILYVTIGTGVGGGTVVQGAIPSASRHPEMGHVTLQRMEGDTMESVCPFHDNCFEGLASGPAIERRWGIKGHLLEPDHPAWELEAEYIAQGLLQLIVVLAPDRVIVGGGVMKQHDLYDAIRKKVSEKLNGYTYYSRLQSMDELIIPPQLGDDSGLVGGLLLPTIS